MSHLTTKAFVLRSVPYGENRRILNVLSEDGRILTFSGQKTKKMSSFNALSQNFVLAEFELFQYKNRLSLDGGSIIYAFQSLQHDWDKLASAAHLAEVFIDALKDHEAMSQAYELWAYSVNHIAESENPLFVVRVSQFRLMSDLGFRPWLYDCAICHSEFEAGMEFRYGIAGLICRKPTCRQQVNDYSGFTITKGLLSTIRYIVDSDYKSLFNFRLSDKLQLAFISFSDRYLELVMEKTYKRLSFGDEMTEFTKNISKNMQTNRTEENIDEV